MGLIKQADLPTAIFDYAKKVSPDAPPISSVTDSVDTGSLTNSLEAAANIVGKNTSSLGKIAVPGLVAIAGGFVIKQIMDKLKNDVRKTRIIEDLSLNDPLLKTVDKRQLYHWYATLCYYAPTLANDKLTVTEVLQNFARFGKVDFNTIKMLVDTEKTVSDTTKNHSENLKNMKTLFTPWK